MWWKISFGSILFVFSVLLVLDLVMGRWLGAAMMFFWLTWWLSRAIETWYHAATMRLIEARRNEIGQI